MRMRIWSGRRDRLVLALLGVVILGAGLSIMSLLSESMRGTVTRTYEETWRAPYDILVHVPLQNGAVLPDITEPNVLTTLPPGITIAQLNAVRSVPGVDTAAPISVIGYLLMGPTFEFPSQEIHIPDTGLYRLTGIVTVTNAPWPEKLTSQMIVARTDPKTGKKPAGTPDEAMTLSPQAVAVFKIETPSLLVAIDPVAEGRLVGLDQALVHGRYLAPAETSPSRHSVRTSQQTIQIPAMPVLVNQSGFRGLRYELTVDELDENLNTVGLVHRQTWLGESLPAVIQSQTDWGKPLLGTSGQLAYRPEQSPFQGRWPVAMALQPASGADPTATLNTYRITSADFGPYFRRWEPRKSLSVIEPVMVGLYEPTRLNIANNSGTDLPLMTYRPAEALHVLSGAGLPINPPRPVAGGLNPTGFLSSPPVMLTTVEAAVGVVGNGLINAIRVKVSGAEHFTPEAVGYVKQVAEEIHRETGLATEVTMGSSPMNVLVKVPNQDGNTGLGWVEEQWIHKGATFTALAETEFGHSVYIGMILVVAVIYGVATALAGVTARRRDLGLLAALGWPRQTIRGMAVWEQIGFALAASLIAVLAGTIGGAPIRTVLWVLAGGLVAYLPAALLAGLAAMRISPGESLRWGDTAPGRRVLPGTGVLPLALSSIMGRPWRTALTILAIALPCSMLVVLLFVAHHLQGVLYTTVTGEYAALRVGPLQYFAGLVALTIASVTAFDLVQQNAADHRQERALLHALGWPRSHIGLTMIVEGTVLGGVAGLLGALVAWGSLAVLYGPVLPGVWGIALAVWLVPMTLGFMTGALTVALESRAQMQNQLAGTGERHVMRFGLPTMVTGAVVSLMLVSLAAAIAIPRTVARMKSTRTVDLDQAHKQAIGQLESAIAVQNDAMDRLDITGYLATVDPASSGFLMERRHWLEGAREWLAGRRGDRITRSVTSVAMLGTNTARVQFLERAGGEPYVVETVWVQDEKGTWLEHDWWQEVLRDPSVTVKYPDTISKVIAEKTAENTHGGATLLLENVGWLKPSSLTWLTVELYPDGDSLARAVAPGRLDPILYSAEFGEPMRFDAGRAAPSILMVSRAMATRAVREQSGNHASEWLVFGLARQALALSGQIQAKSVVDQLRESGPMPLDQLGSVRSLSANRPGESEAAVATAWLLASYLEEQYGPDVIGKVMDLLATNQVDPARAGPENYDLRGRETIAAVEQVSGISWNELDARLRKWFSELAGRPEFVGGR